MPWISFMATTGNTKFINIVGIVENGYANKRNNFGRHRNIY